MPLFLLTPVDRHASDWAYSSTRDPVQIEADTEELARRRANRFLATPSGTRKHVTRQSGRPPWDQRNLVIARVIEEADPAVRLILLGDTPP